MILYVNLIMFSADVIVWNTSNGRGSSHWPFSGHINAATIRLLQLVQWQWVAWLSLTQKMYLSLTCCAFITCIRNNTVTWSDMIIMRHAILSV